MITCDIFWTAGTGVSCALLVINIVYILKTRRGQKRIDAVQEDINRRQKEIGKMIEGPITSEMVGIATWRDMPIEMLPRLRARLLQIVDEIDTVPKPTRH